jgi:hypothetical protein
MHGQISGAPFDRSTHAARPKRAVVLFAITVGVGVAVQSAAGAVKVKVDFDKKFDFRQARTWAWNPEGPGHVMMARTPDDDPAAVQKRNEPIILSAINEHMPRTGLTPASAAPDLTLTYYAFLSVGTSAQTMGQFLPPVTDWGVPPFTVSTTSLEVKERGSLVLDFAAKGEIVWRGIGMAEIPMDMPLAKREVLIRQAISDILRKYPPKQK